MQRDLFESFVSRLPDVSSGRKREFLGGLHMTLRLDQVLIGVIALLILYAFVFSFGVEKGKGLAVAEMKTRWTAKADPVTAAEAKPGDAREYSSAKDTSKKPSEAGLGKREASEMVTSPVPSGKYTIQMITYQTKTAAQRQMRRLSEMGYASFVIPSGSYLQVCLSAFETRLLAVQALQQLKIRGVLPADAYVRTIPR